MRNRGANGSDEDLEKIVGYLTKSFGPSDAPAKVNVNTSSAEEIGAKLRLMQEQAQAIVSYRDTDIDGVKKAPGVDADKIDAVKDSIEY
jgi:DNA uptake protein ComE-like DNA-binding protein